MHNGSDRHARLTGLRQKFVAADERARKGDQAATEDARAIVAEAKSLRSSAGEFFDWARRNRASFAASIRALVGK